MDLEFGLFGGDAFGPDLFDGAVPSSGPSPDGLWVSTDSGWFDVHALDTDADGHPDTGTLSGPGGTVVFTDLDADGVADVYHRIKPDGTFESWRFADGHWHLVDSGDVM